MDVARALQMKAIALEAHSNATRDVRQRIAAVVINDPKVALSAAKRTLRKKSGRDVAWSKTQWSAILQTWSPAQIAKLLINPRPDQEALADSHPFGGVLSLRHAR